MLRLKAYVNITEATQTATTTSVQLKPSSGSTTLAHAADTANLQGSPFLSPPMIQEIWLMLKKIASTTLPTFYTLPVNEPNSTAQHSKTTPSTFTRHSKPSLTGPQITQNVTKCTSVTLDNTTTTASVLWLGPIVRQFSSALRVEDNQTEITTLAPISSHRTSSSALPCSTTPM